MSHFAADSLFAARIAGEAIPFVIPPEGAALGKAVDQMVASLGEEVELLGLGEALHGGEEILRLRNRMFQRLVERHGYSAIAIESSSLRARRVNDYIQGRGPESYEELVETGFGHGLGQLEANRELVEWMRAANQDAGAAAQLSFHGFDIPSGTMGVASPRPGLVLVIDYLAGSRPERAEAFRQRIDDLPGDDAAWENPAVYMDPSKSIALSPGATALRIATEDLIAELRARRPELVAASSETAYGGALREAEIARELLNFHVAMGARAPGESPAVVLGTRDATMAANLAWIVNGERKRGRVLAFAHNSHLQRGEAVWPGQKYWGTTEECRWWPAGAHLASMLGPRYAVIGSAVGVSAENGIGEPEAGTAEALLRAAGRGGLFLRLQGEELAGLPVRSGSERNPTYVPLNAQAAAHFDGIAFLAETTYNRGGPPLQSWGAKAEDPAD